MNLRAPGFLVSKAIPGFLQYKEAEALSPNTIRSYRENLALWHEHIGGCAMSEVTTVQIREFLVWLRTTYKPRRPGGGDKPLAPKTIRNYWVSLAAFFHWAADDFGIPNPVKGVPAPKFQDVPVEPFTREQIAALLKAAEYMREAKTVARRTFTMRRATANRDQALILVLLDTGLRAGDLCALNVGDLDQKTGKVDVKHGMGGGAKGGKGRVVYLGKSCRRTVWQYLAEREDGEDADAPLFIGRLDHRMNKGVLRQLIVGLGEKAGVPKCHPHRYRHTFAITYLRAGGDVFTLPSILGHSTLEMVQHYARVAQMDVEQAHRKASLADNWHL